MESSTRTGIGVIGRLLDRLFGASRKHENAPKETIVTSRSQEVIVKSCETAWNEASRKMVSNTGEWPAETAKRFRERTIELENAASVSDFDSRNFVASAQKIFLEFEKWTAATLPEFRLPQELLTWSNLEGRKARLEVEIAKNRAERERISDVCEKQDMFLGVIDPDYVIKSSKANERKEMLEAEHNAVREALGKYAGMELKTVKPWLDFYQEWESHRKVVVKLNDETREKLMKCRYKLGNLMGKGNEGTAPLERRMRRFGMALSDYISAQEKLLHEIDKAGKIVESHCRTYANGERTRIENGRLDEFLHELDSAVQEVVSSALSGTAKERVRGEAHIQTIPIIAAPSPRIIEVVEVPLTGEIKLRKTDERYLAMVARRQTERKEAKKHRVSQIRDEVKTYEHIGNDLLEIRDSVDSKKAEELIEAITELIAIKKTIGAGRPADTIRPSDRLMEVLRKRDKMPKNIEQLIALVRRVEQRHDIPISGPDIYDRLLKCTDLTDRDRALIVWKKTAFRSGFREIISQLPLPEEHFEVQFRNSRTTTFEQFYLTAIKELEGKTRKEISDAFMKRTTCEYLARHVTKHLSGNGQEREEYWELGVSRITLREARLALKQALTEPSSPIFKEKLDTLYGTRVRNSRILNDSESSEENRRNGKNYAEIVLHTIMEGERFVKIYPRRDRSEYGSELIFIVPLSQSGEQILCSLFNMDSGRWITTFLTKLSLVSRSAQYFAPIPDTK